MPETKTVTVRINDKTPPDLRSLDGRTYPIRPTVPYPAPGARGTLFGIPGVMSEDGTTWYIEPEPPPGTQLAGAQLGDIHAVLVEIRDLLRNRHG
ncbi:hypothetical protein ABZ814_13440 [Micromonospora musae]|uniref:hypothetical protein n=1 Tax=Micromonospora musae TaxID=1894970 RepID=UPI0033DDA2B4